jgi:hypothetical protein
MINIKDWAKKVDEALAKATKESLTAWFEKYDSTLNAYMGDGNYGNLSGVIGIDSFRPSDDIQSNSSMDIM